MSRKWLVVLGLLVVVIAGVYLWPVRVDSFEELYADVPPEQAAGLLAFRAAHPLKTVEVDGVEWEYLTAGEGEKTMVFLHGMTGHADIWWGVMELLVDDYSMIAVTYPPVESLAEMEAGVLAVLDAEGVGEFYVVGTSLGGYLAQYLAAQHPERVVGAAFANTFPPNEILAEKNGTIGALIPYLPEWLVIGVLQGSIEESIYPASGNDPLTLAFLYEVMGRMSKADVDGRYQCVVEWFAVQDTTAVGVMVLIIEASNDPLVEEELRERMKETYPNAGVWTVDNGHFPYLADPEAYADMLRGYFAED